MTEDQIYAAIVEIISQTLDDKGLDVPEITPETEVLGDELGIDSLDLATLVSELEKKIGFDPFAKGFIEFKTVGELTKLYVR
ncbi:acyl carrier protein [Asticcacaulis sp. ZE23SCel15]|uniref:Acyl carrier protein n=1 Tax=Asticcacaulis machinosus TaxID=2984211 RepID=A0ABT5HJX7_9CAUL|nr:MULTISPECIES: acyl carrier protein [Asticcacaulis]MDC7676552.1 acyl carrier protein [Asticcacaulis machinosus]WKL58336.1 acyl carrier protein [Asticcacaulis sp. ZE23SCel15]